MARLNPRRIKQETQHTDARRERVPIKLEKGRTSNFIKIMTRVTPDTLPCFFKLIHFEVLSGFLGFLFLYARLKIPEAVAKMIAMRIR